MAIRGEKELKRVLRSVKGLDTHEERSAFKSLSKDLSGGLSSREIKKDTYKMGRGRSDTIKPSEAMRIRRSLLGK